MQQEEAARRIGVATSTVSKWEAGKRIPGSNVIGAIADAYGVTTDYLVLRSESRTSLHADDWLVDLDKLEGLREGRSALSLTEPMNSVGTNGKTFKGPRRFAWATKVPRRAMVVDHATWERLDAEVRNLLGARHEGGGSRGGAQ